MDYATREFAAAAVRHWCGDSATLEHISDSGNSVYRFTREGERLILRLTDPNYRSKSWNLAELDYLLQLHAHDVAVGLPVASASGRLIEDVSADRESWMASVFTYAPGEMVDSSSPYWNEAFFHEWGRTLARMHRVSSTYVPDPEHRRWHWHEEDLVANAVRYIPADDTVSLREFDYLAGSLRRLPVDPRTYGLTHADLGAQNFHFSPQHGITVFDFGNCCYHWYVSDIAIALSTLRRNTPEQRAIYRAWILAGYEEIFPLDPVVWEHLDTFIRWRVLYVYLDRLERFGPTPTPEQRQIVDSLRERVHQQAAGLSGQIGS